MDTDYKKATEHSHNDAILEIRGLNIAYEDFQVIEDLHLNLMVGEVLGLIGPNGAGKSTLIRAISGVVPAQSGEIKCFGGDFLDLPPAERAKTLAVVPQARQLGGALSVEQTVLMGRTAYMGLLGRPSEADLEAAWLAMEQTHVENMAHRRNSELSGGEQQRVLLARALAQQTRILLLDEPTSHLDLSHQANFLSLVMELAQERDLGVIMAFHDLNLVAAYTHRIAMLVAGRIHALGPPAEVLTAENIQTAYNTAVQIITHPDLDTPMVFPKRR